MRKPLEPITATKLARFLTANKLAPAAVAREAGISRQHLLRIRKGDADPAFTSATRIRDACGQLLMRPVSFDELFDANDPQARRTWAATARKK